MTAPITLTYGQHVNMEGWSFIHASTVFTVEGYAKANGYDVERLVNKAIHNGGAAQYEREHAPLKAATVLKDGQRVVIEGREYTVKAMGSRYSDPIHFKAVQ